MKIFDSEEKRFFKIMGWITLIVILFCGGLTLGLTNHPLFFFLFIPVGIITIKFVNSKLFDGE